MSKHKELRDIEEEKCKLVAKATLQRSAFLLLASPFFKVVRAAEAGIFAVKTGKAIARHMNLR